MAASNKLNSYYESFITQALERNDKSVATWSKYRDDLEVTKSLLTLIPKKVTNNVMVPIGPKALMRGKIVHTNEYLVNLGETWFVKRSAHQTIEICDRRIKTCAEMLEKLEKEKELILNKTTLPVEQDAFGNEERREIIEYISEEECEKWKKQHRIIEKQYRQKLAELRNKEKNQSEVEDIWKHLDELELQEELEDELNRLNDQYNINNDSEEVLQPNTLFSEDDQDFEEEMKEKNFICEKNMKNVNIKKKVSFACDLDSSDDEPLRLEIKHSKVKSAPCISYSEGINSPAEIYNHYKTLRNEKPVSVLKSNISNNEKSNLNLIDYDEILSNNEEENLKDNPTVSIGAHLYDIFERNVSNVANVQKSVDLENKKISKFKASRKKIS